nr:lysophospholipid acyltransferase family protein [Thalassovita sp.]
MPPEPEAERIGVRGWTRALRRGVPLGGLVFGGLAVLLTVRLIEAPVFGVKRPITPFITQFVCRNAFRLMGIRFDTDGEVMRESGAVVANHASWLDIFALNARKRVYFVSKSEVAGWPGIGWLARATGTVFINRNPKEAKIHQDIFERRLLSGHKLLFFPEGTSTDSLVVLPFKSTLFQAFFTDHLKHEMYIQPVTLIYRAPEDADPRFYGWWGEMEFGPHLLKVLAAPRQGSVSVLYHAPVRVDDFPNRKTLAAHAEQAVRAGLTDR